MRVFVGYDPIDEKAFQVCQHSLLSHASIPVEIEKIWDKPLRQRGIYWRPYRVSDGKSDGEINGQMYDLRDGKPFSTAFSFARFAVPIVADYADEWVMSLDPDMLWRADIAELFAYVAEQEKRSRKALYCVQHDHEPTDETKMDGRVQTRYHRKNWSSVMVMNPARCRMMTPYLLNRETGARLHALTWLTDDAVGALPEEWNWLEGWSDPDIDPKIVHHTRGTPDMAGHEGVPYAADWWNAYWAAMLSICPAPMLYGGLAGGGMRETQPVAAGTVL